MKSEAIKKMINFIARQKRPFKVNMVRASANTFLRRLTIQYRSVYILRLGADVFQLGVVNSLGGIAGTVIALPTGWSAGRYGIRNVFLLATSLMALGSLLLAMTFDWRAAIPAVFLVMLATQMLSTACPIVCGSYLKDEERATGRQLCDTFSALPGLAAPVIAATLISRFGGLTADGNRPLYFLQILGFLALLVYTYKFYFDTRKRQSPFTSSGFIEDTEKVFERGIAVKRWILYISLSSITMYLSTTYLPAFVTEIKYGNEFVLGSMTTAS